MPRAVELVDHRLVSPDLSLRRWRHRRRSATLFAPAAHAGLELSWVLSGEATFSVGSRNFTAGPGDVVLVPAGHEHRTELGPAMEGVAIEVATQRAEGLIEGRVRVQDAALMQRSELPLLLGLFLEEAEHRDPAGRVAAEGLADAILVRALRAQPQSAHPLRVADRQIRAAIDFAHAHFTDPIDVGMMARAAGMSRYHFSRRFRALTGKTPYQYLLDVRLSAAEGMLRRGDRSVTAVAFSCGYSCPSRFARAFRQRTGRTPSDYGAMREAASATASRSAPSTSRSESESNKGS